MNRAAPLTSTRIFWDQSTVWARPSSGIVKLLIAFILIAPLWGCEVDPDEARFRLGELGYEYHPRSLFLAAMRNDHVAVELLILSGMDPDAELTYHYAIKPEKENWLPDFRNHLTGPDSFTPYWKRHHQQPDENRRGVREYTTPLVVAAILGNTQAAASLLDAGADVNKPECHELTALMWAVENGHTETVELLLDAEAYITQAEDGDSPLTAAAGNNDLVMIQLLLDAGVDVFLQNNLNITALIEAATEGNLDIMTLLIDAGAAADAQGEDGGGETALMAAATAGNVDAVRMLLDAGADPHLRNANGATALSMAALAGSAEIVRMLLDAGVDPNLQTNEGDTVLMLAASKGSIEVIRSLLDAGADPNLQNGDGETALAKAVTEMRRAQGNQTTEQVDWRRSVITTLLDAGANPDLPNQDGTTVFMTMFKTKDVDAVKALLDAGADPKQRYSDGESLLMREIRTNRNLDLFQLLLDAISDLSYVNLQKEDGLTALMMAVNYKRAEAVRSLMAAGADPDIQNNKGQAALMYAASSAELDTVKALLDGGADPTLKDAEGISVLNYVPAYRDNIRDVLQEAMNRPRNPEANEASEPAPAASPTASPVLEIEAGPTASLTNETYLGGMKTRGMKVYALSGDGNWCAEKVVFKITAPSDAVFTDGTAEFYMKRFGERINEAQFCPAARSADIHGYTDTGSEPVFTGKATAAAGWSVN